MFNSAIASEREYNVEVPYFNLETGVKISKFIENAETLTPRSVKKEENLKQVTEILRNLHEDKAFRMDNKFNMFRELEKYEEILRKDNGTFFAGYDEVIGETIVKSKNMTVEKKTLTHELPYHLHHHAGLSG